MKVPIEEIKALCKRILLGRGLDEREAMIIVEDYLDAEMRGKPSHGVRSFSVVAGDCLGRGKAERILDRGPLLFFEGHGDIGHLVAYEAVSWAEGICKEHGFAIAGMRDIRRFATPGSVARRAAEKGMIALVLQYGGKAFMAPYGAAEPVISTNPIGIGIPTAGDPLILDMATSERAFYFISLAKALGEKIPEAWGIDHQGRPVTDPSDVAAVSPFGGYKGYGLSLMLEILTGPFLGVDVGLKGDLSKRGALCLFFSPSLFGVKEEEFHERIKGLVRDIKNARIAPGHEEVFLPGEQGEHRRRDALREGVIDLEREAYTQLQALLAP